MCNAPARFLSAEPFRRPGGGAGGVVEGRSIGSGSVRALVSRHVVGPSPARDGARSGARDVTVLSEYEVRRGKMNVQFIANV